MTTIHNPLIERYYASTRTSQELQLARLEHFTSHPSQIQFADTMSLYQAMQTSHALHDYAYQHADKYQLTASALTMISYLQPQSGMQAMITNFPDLPVWMETEQLSILAPHRPAAGIFFWKPSHQALADTWVLAVVNGQGVPFLHFAYSEQLHQWSISPLHTCPFQACQLSGWQGSHLFATAHLRPCRNCREALDHWQAWCATALLTIQGVFATEENVREKNIMSSIRKQPGKGTNQDLLIQHQYHVVTFDACIKRSHPKRSERHPSVQEPNHGGKPWHKIDPTTFVYVKRSILAGQRHLSPARCSRWKYERTVPVRAHEKRVLIRLDLLKTRFTRVIASKF